MLRELHISNLAVIADVSVELAEGLNCFTGQTGAGKSLVLGAFEILLGLRAAQPAELVRPGTEEARVSGVFEVHDDALADQVAALLDQPVRAGDQLLITRKLFASGRSGVSVNGQPATAAMVKAVGELLVDVHGQHDHQYLLKPANQLAILDAYAHLLEQRQAFAEHHAALHRLQRRRRDLTASRALRRQQLDLYEFQAQEIDAAEPLEGELAELQARHALLGNVQRIKQEATQAHAALHDSEGSIIERLQMVAHVIVELAELDERLRPLAEQVRSATLSLQDSAYELGGYADRLDLDPAELSEIEDRLNTLNRLASKYAAAGPRGDDAVAHVLAYRARIAEEISRLRGEDEDCQQIDADIAVLQAKLAQVGSELSRARRAAAAKLTPLVERELADLGMADAKLVVEFETVDPKDESSAASGLDRVELLVRTNPGQPARPLRKIASGGELSRIMLALKAVIAQADRVSVLVFDEIDANIGGRLGTVIGAKLRKLVHGGGSTPGGGGGHQVLCITHLPQIAAFADRHLRIEKRVEGKGKAKQTMTTVTLLEGRERVEELAEMMAGKGVTATTRKQAEELMAAAV